MGPAAPGNLIFFFPLMAPGHILPMTDMARLFAARGVRCAIITTPSSASLVRRSVERANGTGLPIALHLIEFPAADVGLPEGIDSLTLVTSPEMSSKFFSALDVLREPFEQLLIERRPHAVITDMFLPWTAEVAQGLGVPRLVFHGMGFFPLGMLDVLDRHEADIRVAFVAGDRVAVPGLPHRVELLRSQLHDSLLTHNEFGKFMTRIWESERGSYGAVVNSFYELEPEYVDHYRYTMKRKAWHIGPVSLCNADRPNIADRNESDAPSREEPKERWFAWLDSKKSGSVIYVCFGSLCMLTAKQLHEIAMGLEISGHNFIWVVRNSTDEGQQWLPQGFEERVAGEGGRGLVIRGWAPQVLILGHPVVGGFMTHCGWNSVLEGVSAGLPMVTWPLCAEQFYNERLVVDVLGVGVPAGAEQWGMREEEKAVVDAHKVAAAVARVMGGGSEAEQMRGRATALKEKARKAVEPRGSSREELGRLVDELRSPRAGGLSQ